MYLVDTRTRRAWPPYWAAHKFKAIRAEVIRDLTEGRRQSNGTNDGGGVACLRQHAWTERAIREETERRFAIFCRKLQDLEAYRREVGGDED